MQAPESTDVDFSRGATHLRRASLSSIARRRAKYVDGDETLRGDTVASFDAELWLWFFAGVSKQRWTRSQAAATSSGSSRRPRAGDVALTRTRKTGPASQRTRGPGSVGRLLDFERHHHGIVVRDDQFFVLETSARVTTRLVAPFEYPHVVNSHVLRVTIRVPEYE